MADRCTSEHKTESGGMVRCKLEELHDGAHSAGSAIWQTWAEPVTASDPPRPINELEALRAENARLRAHMTFLRVKIDELAKAVMVP